MSFILSLDQGTTSSRAILFDRAANIVASDQYEFAQHYPQSGWVEHDANEIWDTQWRAILGALDKAGCGFDSIEAIGIANQRETVVFWNRETGEPACPAIVWQDRRTADRCRELKAEGKESWIQDKTGLLLDPYFSGSKIEWALQNCGAVAQLSGEGKLAVGTIDTWLIWKLTEGRSHVTDVSNASRTLLMDIGAGDWDAGLLELFGVPKSALPQIVDSSGELAETDANLTGGRTIPVSGIAGDQQAALFGQVCFKPGMIKCTYGTGCFVLMNVGDAPTVSTNKLLSTVAWRVDGKIEYALEGSVFIGGAAVQWLRDELKIIENAPEVEALAASVKDSNGVVVVPAFTGLGAPHWDPYARGAIFGLSRGASSAHIARATLESIALQVVDLVDAMKADSTMDIVVLQADGGASRNAILMQAQADLLDLDVTCPKIAETTALGAAFLAGLAVGYWKSKEEIADLWRMDRQYHPNAASSDRNAQIKVWRKAVERVKNWEA